MKYVFVAKFQGTKAQKEFAEFAGRKVKDTSHVHAVIGFSEWGIVVKYTTCFCNACF